jgi:L-threonylcarbamoyladenylate synthase
LKIDPLADFFSIFNFQFLNMPILWRITDSPTAVQLHEIAKLLIGGGVVLLPTDTIYGLHAAATNEAAVARIAEIKGREDTKPFVVIAGAIEQLDDVGVETSSEILAKLRKIWPAPLTAILPVRKPIAATRGRDTIAIRIPDLDWLRGLAVESGPLVSTSANRSGDPPVETPDALARDLQDRIDAIADAGPQTGQASAILDLSGAEPRLIREGAGSFTQKVWKSLWNSL